MPLSDNYKYNVGDRVKNDLTQEDGRVIDLKPLGEGALLVTVAIFIAGVAVSNKSFVQKIGQISGLEWTVIGTAVKDGASKLPLITNPMEGGTVSAKATEIALSNEPSDRSISKLIADRLKSWNPRLADANDPLAYINAVRDRIANLERIRTGVFKRKGQLDLLLNYMTATGHKDANGQWVGSYLVELVHNRSSAAASAIEKGDKIRRILQQTGIPAELSLRYRSLIPEGVNTAWELLVHAKQRIANLNYAEGNPLWNDYAAIIRNAVELAPGRKRMQARIDGLNEALDFTRDHLSSLESASFTSGPSIAVDAPPGYLSGLHEAYTRPFDPTSFQVEGGRTAPEESARSMHQLERRMFGASPGAFEEARIGVRAGQFKKPGEGGFGVVRKTSVAVARKGPGGPLFQTHGRLLNPAGFARLPEDRHRFPYNVAAPATRFGHWSQGRFIEAPAPHSAAVPSIVPGIIREREAELRAAEIEATARFSSPPGRVRASGRGIDPFTLHRQEQGPALDDVLEGAETVLGRDVGARTRSARGKPIRTRTFFGEDILQHGPPAPGGGPGGHFTGKIVQYKGLPYRVTAVDLVTRRATLAPLHSEVELLASDITNRPRAALEAVKQAGRGRANLPLVGGIQQQQERDATRIAAQIADRKTIAIKGGLLGTAKETVQVPIDLLREYLAGPATFKTADTLSRSGMPVFKDTQALKTAGFAGQSDFGEKAGKFSRRFEAELKKRLETHPLLTGASGKFAEEKLEELIHGARIAVVQHLGGIRGSRTIQQIEEELLRVGVEQSAAFAFGDSTSVVAQTFTELDKVNDAGELVESGLDRVSRVAGKRAVSHPWPSTRLDTTHYVMMGELEHDISRFAGAVQDLRWGRDYSKIAGHFSNVFGRYATIRPDSIPDLESHILHQGQLATELYDLMQSGDLGTEDGQKLLKRFARAQNIRVISGAKWLEDDYALYRETLEKHGASHPDTIAASKIFQEEKSSAVEKVQERYYAQRILSPREFKLRLGVLAHEVHEDIPETVADYRRAWRKAFPLSPRLDDPQAAVEAGLRLHKEHWLGNEGVSERTDKLAAFARGAGYFIDRGKDTSLVPITKANEKETTQLYQAAMSLPVEEQPAALRALGVQPTLLGDTPVAALSSRSGDRFILRPAQGGLAAVSEANPHLAHFLGDANQPFELSLGELEAAAAKGEARLVMGDTAEILTGLRASAERASKESFLHNFVGQAPTSLPVFKGNGVVAGFLENDLVNAQSVIENAKAALSGKRALLFIDIETNREVNQITMFAAHRLEKIDGVWQEVGAPFQAATRDLWNHPAIHGSVGSRLAIRNGYMSSVDELLENEQEIGEWAALLFASHSDALIVGHNIPFDIGKLAKMEGLEQSAADILTDAAKTRVTDTLLIAQLTHPGQSSYGLEGLGSAIAGQPEKEAHLALPDVYRTMEVFKQQAARSEQGIAALNALEQVKLNDDSVLWFSGGKQNVRGRAFKVAGILDAEAAGDAFYKQTGQDLNVGFGVALQPVSFLTGKAEGPIELNYARTPHGWASAFAGQAQVLDQETARAEMEAKVNDLARRRVRRVTSGDGSFTRLLAERERLPLAAAASQGPTAFAAAQDDLLQRYLSSSSEAERELLSRTHRYSETFLQDTRTARQLQMESAFFKEEVGGIHAPVVNWLESALKGAAGHELPALRQTANRVWSDYMAQVEGVAPFTHEPVVPKASVSLKIPALGENPVALFTRDANSLRRSLQEKVFDIAEHIKDTHEFNNLFAHAPQEEIDRVKALMANRKNFLDAELGPTIEQHIFERHISPALQDGLVQLTVDEETRAHVPLHIKARNIDEAVQNILGRTGDIVSKTQETAENPLIPRSIAADALSAIRERIGVGGDLLTEAERTLTAENLRVGFHHNAPKSWTGKSFLDLFNTAVSADALEQIQFTDRMKGIYKKMATPDQGLLGEVVQKAAPQWFDEITGVKKADEIIAAAAPVRDFNPGTIVKAGVEVGEAAAQNANALKGLGLIGLGVISAGVALLARRPQRSPGKTAEQDDQEKILHSTEKEVQRRKEHVANQVPMVNRISVNISGNDPNGVSHDELIQSVHSSLGSFLGTEISRSANVHDNRSRIDRNYLDRVAGQLLQKPTPVR